MVGLGQGEEGRPTAAPPGHPSGSGDPLPVGQRPRWTLLPARATAAATLAWWPAMLTLPALAATAKAALPLWLTTLVPPRFIVVRAGRSSICWSSNMVSPRIGGDMQCARRGPQPSPADSPAGPVDADPGRGPVSTAPTLAPRRATGNGGRHVSRLGRSRTTGLRPLLRGPSPRSRGRRHRGQHRKAARRPGRATDVVFVPVWFCLG